MDEYYVNGIRVTKERFLKIVRQLETSNMDWEIDNGVNRTDLYTFG